MSVTSNQRTYRLTALVIVLLFAACVFQPQVSKADPSAAPAHYSAEEEADFEVYVEECFGNFEYVIHEIVSDGLHIDIIPIPPSEERDYYTLVTMGMGALRMAVPPEMEPFNRAEVAIRLPKDWKIDSEEEEWSWPADVLKTLARLPYEEDSWLGMYHDIDFVEPFSGNTKLCGVLLDFLDETEPPFVFQNGDAMIIFNVIPLYRSELDYLHGHDAPELLEKMTDAMIHGPVNINRNRVV